MTTRTALPSVRAVAVTALALCLAVGLIPTAATAAPASPGAVAAADPDAFFPTDASTLAIFEFNGDVLDSSGNGRDATLLDPASTYEASTYGQGLVLPAVGGAAQGIDWSAYASLLVPPYTVEVLVYPTDVGSWKRLFTHDQLDDGGLYYYGGSLQNYPEPPLSGVSLPPNTLHCLAWSAPVTPDRRLDLYLDGTYLGQVGRGYDVPSQAWFFMDDTGAAPNENIDGFVDAMRISNVARTGTELANACEASNAGTPLATVPDAPTALAVDAVGGGAELTWSAPASDGGSAITDYLIEYSVDGITWSTFPDGTSTATSASLTGLDPGPSYVFRVSAVNAVGAGPTTAASAPVAILAVLAATGADGEAHAVALAAAGALLLLGAAAAGTASVRAAGRRRRTAL